MHRVFIIFLGMLLLFIGQAAHAQDNDYIVSQSYYADKTNQLSLDEVKAQVFKPYEGLLTGGFSKGGLLDQARHPCSCAGLGIKDSTSLYQ